jgi:hypothetical protein
VNRRILLGTMMMVGCGEDHGQPMRMPLAPARPVSFELTVSPQQVAVTMLIPVTFHLHQMGNIVTAAEGPRFPRAEIQAAPGPLGEPVIFWDDNCKLDDGTADFQWTVSERIPEQDGVLFVCVDPKTKATAVVRHFSWEGHPIECSLPFGGFEPAPSAARVFEAKQICDSVALRHPIE